MPGSFLNKVAGLKFYGVDGIINGGAYFRGFMEFGKLRYQARFIVAEASLIKQPRPLSNFKNIVKRYAGGEVDIKEL